MLGLLDRGRRAADKSIVKAVIREVSSHAGQPVHLTRTENSRTGALILWLAGEGISYIGKIALTESSALRLQHHTKILEKLETELWCSKELLEKFPQSILNNQLNGYYFCVETRLEGAPGSVTHMPPTLRNQRLSAATDFLTDLHTASRSEVTVSERVWNQRIAPMFRAVGSLAATWGREDRCNDLCRYVQERIIDRTMPFVMVHGNYWLGNILFESTGRLTGVIDWDLASDCHIPLSDLYHLLIRAESLLLNLALGEVVVHYDRRLPHYDLMPAGFQHYCSALGIGEELWRPLLFFHWAEHIHQHILYKTAALTKEQWIRRNLLSVLDAFQDTDQRGSLGGRHVERDVQEEVPQSTPVVVRPVAGTDRAAQYRLILEQLKDAGIEYCLLRDRLNGQTELKDLDLLIDAQMFQRCREYLRQLGFLLKPTPKIPLKTVFIRYRDGQLLYLDLHSKAVQDGMMYMDEQAMLARKIRKDGLYYLSPEDECIHLILHNMLRPGALRASSLERMREALNQPLDWAYITGHLDRFGLTHIFKLICDWLRQSHTSGHDIVPLRKQVRQAVLRAAAGNRIRHYGYTLRRKILRRPKGGLIAIVGPDGSGKSTVVEATRKRTRMIDGLKIETAYLGPWGQMEMPWIRLLRSAGIIPSIQPWGAWLFARRNTGNGSSDLPGISDRPRLFLLTKWLKSLAKGWIFYPVIYLELLWRYLTSVLLHVRRGRWVLADRYITDLRYLYKGHPIRNYPVLRYVVCRLFPKPDLFIFLDNKPDVIHARKNELSVEQIKTFRSLYLEAIHDYPHEIIQTDRSPDEIADHIVNRILELSVSR